MTNDGDGIVVDEETTERFWEEHYGRRAQVWSGRANEVLVSEVERLEPGVALDLGCGEGADAVWLATKGWRVVAVDVSATALARGAAQADHAGVGARVEWQRHDLARWTPDRQYDLVSAQFFQSPVALPREDIFRMAASALRAGGTMLIVSHANAPSWASASHARVHLPTSREVYDSLTLVDHDWQIERCEESLRAATGPDGLPGTLLDQVLRIRRV